MFNTYRVIIILSLLGVAGFSGPVRAFNCARFVLKTLLVDLTQLDLPTANQLSHILTPDQILHYQVWQRFAIHTPKNPTEFLHVPAPEWLGYFGDLQQQFAKKISTLKVNQTADSSLEKELKVLENVVEGMEKIKKQNSLTVEQTLFYSALYVEVAVSHSIHRQEFLSTHAGLIQTLSQVLSPQSISISDRKKVSALIKNIFFVRPDLKILPVPTFEDLGKPDARGYLKFNPMVETPFQYYGMLKLDYLNENEVLKFDGIKSAGPSRFKEHVHHDKTHHSISDGIGLWSSNSSFIDLKRLLFQQWDLVTVWRSAYPSIWSPNEVLDAETQLFYMRHELNPELYDFSLERSADHFSQKKVWSFFHTYSLDAPVFEFLTQRYWKGGKVREDDFGVFYMHEIPFSYERWKKVFTYLQGYFTQ